MTAAVKLRSPFNWMTTIRIVVTVSILAYLGSRLSWSKIADQLARSDGLWLFLATILIGITFLIATLRWWLLLRIQQIFLPIKTVGALTFIGHFFNSFLLGATGGDVVKVFYVVKYAPSQKIHATLTVIMDRTLGLFVLLCIALLFLPAQLSTLHHAQEMSSIVHALSIVLMLGAVVAASLVFMPLHWMPRTLNEAWKKLPAHHIVELSVKGFRQHRHALGLTAGAVICSSAIWFLVFLASYCIARGIGLSVTYTQMVLIISVVIIVISLPISVAGHGVREGAFIFMFSVFGIIGTNAVGGHGNESAILFSLLFYALFSVWSIVGGLVYLAFQHPYRRANDGLA